MARLAIQCELLLGSYQASDPFAAPETPEWPPHPFRLHAALVEAACERGDAGPSDSDVEALRWLERQGLPAIHCSRVISERDAPNVFVPRNPVPVEFSRSRGAWRKKREFIDPWQRNARRFPTAVPASSRIVYRWSDVGEAPAALDELSAGIGWLGSSRSPVACAVVDAELDSATFVPVAGHGRSLRVASAGVTDGLLETRHEWPTAVEPPVASYGDPTATAITDRQVRTGPFGELLIRSVQDPIHDVKDAALLTGAMRRALLAICGDAAPAIIHGHGLDEEHGAFLALGDVGHRHACGLVRGLALALPQGTSASDRAACREAVASLDRITLGKGLRPLALGPQVPGLLATDPARWARPARRFATVTPMILDRFPRRGRTAEDELRATLATAGYPGASVEVLEGPAVRGAPTVWKLGGDLPPGLRVHAHVEFEHPVRGPVLAGRGRFRGVGLALPLPEGDERRGT